MRVLVLSDVHNRVENLEKTIRLIHNRGVEAVFVLGDLTNLGGKRQAEEVLGKLKGFRVWAIAGNFDTGEVAQVLEERGVSLHGRREKVGGRVFAGFGGGDRKSRRLNSRHIPLYRMPSSA